jgi:carotenoid cleavage dioxygenase-like enzyme
MVYDGTAKKSRFVVLDGQAVEKGPVAQVLLPVLLPYGFHGFWEA